MRFVLTLILSAIALPAIAGPASDAVRYFYSPEVNDLDPANRSRFTDPALAKLAEYDKSSSDGTEVGCIDWVLALDAQDFDDAELAKSLKLEETVEGDKATVTARFRLFADDASSREIIWDMTKVDGAWKVADIASPASDWRLSALDCSN